MANLEILAGYIARVLLEIGAIGFDPAHPVTFKSGIQSPVYVDNRRLPFHPESWARVIDGFRVVIAAQGIEFDVLAGIEAAGIPHSAALGYALGKPSVFVRKQPKEHGTRQRIEGGDVMGRRVLLIEDLVTTGVSSMSGVTALREAGAIVEDLLAIFSYGFPAPFEKENVRLTTLSNFDAVWDAARGDLPAPVIEAVEDWRAAPEKWGR